MMRRLAVPSWSTKTLWIAFVGAFALVACGPAMAEIELVPGTSLPVEEFLIPADRERPLMASALQSGALCFARGINNRRFSNGALQRVGLKTRFDPHYEHLKPLPDVCRVRLDYAPPAVRQGDMTFETVHCRFLVKADDLDAQSIYVQLKNASRRAYHNCLYRTALVVDGFSGALTAQDDQLFWENDRSFFRSEQAFVGDWTPDPIVWFNQLCRRPDLQSLTRSNLRKNRICRDV